MLNVQNLLEFSKQLAYQAGDIMLKHFQIGIAQEIKADNTPVTIADKEINNLVIEAIKKTYPNHSVLGEEENYIKEGSEYVWMCDPIDGTIPYSFGIPVNVFTLALLRDGASILSVVYDPYMKRLFSAIQGKGAFCNDAAIHVSNATNLKDCVIGVSGNNTNKAFDAFSFRAEFQRHTSYQPQFLSFSYEAMMVALGQFSAAIFPGTIPHDVAPLKVIVEEAGGKVTSLKGKDQRYDRPINGAILSNGLIHEELVELAKPFLYSLKT